MKKVFALKETYLVIVIAALIVVITVVNHSFFTLENLFDLLKSYSFLGIFAMGVLVVLISGGIDISFTAVATVAQYVMAVTIIRLGGNMFTAFVIAAVMGMALGFINALLIYIFNIPTIITTVATLNIFYGLLTVFSGGKWIYSFPIWFRHFAEVRLFTLTTAAGAPYGLSLITLIWFGAILVTFFILRFTHLGRNVYALGGNLIAAKRIGLNIFRLQVFVYVFMGFMAGVAGLVQALLVQMVAPNSIVGKELDVLAAVVLGGANLAGGSGTIVGTLLGVSLIAILGNGMTLMRIPSYWYNVFIGLVILFSVGLSAYRLKKRFTRSIEIGN